VTIRGLSGGSPGFLVFVRNLGAEPILDVGIDLSRFGFCRANFLPRRRFNCWRAAMTEAAPRAKYRIDFSQTALLRIQSGVC
jgi:hypothetical protein